MIDTGKRAAGETEFISDRRAMMTKAYAELLRGNIKTVGLSHGSCCEGMPIAL